MARFNSMVRLVKPTWLIPMVVVCVWAMGTTGPGADDAVPAGFRAIPLHNMSAADFANEARSLLTQTKTRADVFVDSDLNRVLVRGPEAAQNLVADLAKTVDQPAESAPPIKSNAEVVRGYRVAPEELDSLVAKLQKRFPASTKARIAAEKRTNQIVVVGPAAVQLQVDQFLKQAGRGATPDASSTQNVNPPGVHPDNGNTYQLQNLSWKELEDSLRAVWGGAMSVSMSRNGEVATMKMPNAFGERELLQIDRRNEQIHVPGNDGITQVWQRLVRAMDSGPRGPDRAMQLTTIRKADPNQVQQAVRLLNSATRQSRDPNQAMDAVGVGANGRTGGGNLVSMIFPNGVNGQPPRNTGVRGDVRVAQNQPDPNQRVEQAVPLNAPNQPNGQVPVEGLGNAEGLLEDGGLLGDVQLEFVPEMGIIVVKGHKRDVEKVMKIIQEIEKQSQQTQPKIEVVQLKHANSTAMAEMLVEIYEEIFEPRQGAVSITGLGKPNAVLLIGREEAVTVVRDLVEKLDQPVDDATQFDVYNLKYADATLVQEAIQTFFEERTGLGARVVVVAETRSNALIVQAAPRDMAEVRGIVTKIDVPGGTGKSHEVRIFRLKNALAQELATVLQDAISGTTSRTGAGTQGAAPGQVGGGGGAAANQARQSALELILVDPEAGKIFRSGILSDVRVRADTNGNALIVTAPPQSMDLVASLIDKLDQLPGGESQIKVFTVENGDATSLMGTLQQVFGQQVTAGQGAGGLFGGGINAAQFGQQQSGAGAGESSLVPLRFAVDVRTNSIIVSGASGDLKVLEALLLRLDEGDIATRKIQVFRLKNAFAQDVYTSLQTFLTSQRQILQLGIIGNQSLITPFEQLETQVAIAAEPATNTIIVSATPRYFDQVKEVIEKLDYRPPMVLVQVLIAEVSLNDTRELGVELGLQDSLVFDRGKAATAANPVATPGFNFTNPTNGVGLPNVNSQFQETLAGQSLTTLGVGRGTGTGLILSAANESINILVRALERSGRAQVLSRPQIMAIHNRQASVLIGEQVPRITSSSINQQGNVQNNVTDVDVGLILNIIPQINNDGIVIMNIQAERSTVGPEADGIQIATTPSGEPIRQPRINNTSAITTVSARSGQTVVFAGLIRDDKQITLRRVPYLSDIPVIGKLFEFSSNFQERRELMIVMTPHIVQSDEDYDWVKAIESERMSWCLGEVVSMHGDVGLRGDNCLFCTNKLPVIYPDSQPSGAAGLPPGLPPGAVIPEQPFVPEYQPRRGIQASPEMQDMNAVPPAVNVEESATGAAYYQFGPPPPPARRESAPVPNYPYGNEAELQPPPSVRLSRLPRVPRTGDVAPINFTTEGAPRNTNAPFRR